MRHGHIKICLYKPEIPQNVGNIARLAAATASRLLIVTPVGFSLDDKNLMRPGLDYWPYLDLEFHSSFDKVIETYGQRLAFFSKKAEKVYTEMPKSTDILVFGQETQGLPQEFFEKYPDMFYKIPLFHPGVRSLNLANSVAIGTYHQLEQRVGFLGGKEDHDRSCNPDQSIS